ncbi:hypothetical protein PUN28_019444 [Cardiocondyla obscurior]|uniref:Uncharacterized protein n=1 Tax=Cardiocondyla obscurior TaxID=286306 RepID=A0AAW2EFR3_9HYME
MKRFNHPLFTLSKNILSRGKLITADYITRAKILMETNICKRLSKRQIEFVNANFNIAHLIDIFLYEVLTVTRISKYIRIFFYLSIFLRLFHYFKTKSLFLIYSLHCRKCFTRVILKFFDND